MRKWPDKRTTWLRIFLIDRGGRKEEEREEMQRGGLIFKGRAKALCGAHLEKCKGILVQNRMCIRRPYASNRLLLSQVALWWG